LLSLGNFEMNPKSTVSTSRLRGSLAKQKNLIEDCIRSGANFAEGLEGIGWTYDDLQYEINQQRTAGTKITGNPQFLSLADFQKKRNGIPVVSFFSGAGGLDLGFEAAGFEHLALVEKNELFCQTIRLNRPDWQVFGPPTASGDVASFDDMVAQLEPALGAGAFEGVFIGGPPCQPFSIAANQRFSKTGKDFKRVGFAHELNGNLLFDYIELIKHFRPSAFLIENVPGLLEVDDGAQLQAAYKDLESHGYTVQAPMVLGAANFHVPQNRTRLFVVGSRTGRNYAPPTPSGSPLSCAAVFDQALTNVANHVTRAHSAESIGRYMKLDFGARDQLGRVDRLNPVAPSKTVIAGGTKGGGRSHLHPRIPRTLSVRECARLQTFPDDYVFTGPVARQFTQVGNAVPPILGAQLGASMAQSYF
jgi:DNA (cytosine-5)-methyltransferase 1